MSNEPRPAMRNRTLALPFILAAFLGSASPALAAGTVVDTNVSTQATLSFNQGGTSSLTATDTQEFRVGRVVDMVVSPDVVRELAPGQTEVDLSFTLTNTGNGTDTFTLDAETSIAAADLVSVQLFTRVATRSGDVWEPVTDVTLDPDESRDVVVRVTVTEDYSTRDESTVSASLAAISQFAAGSGARDKTSAPAVFRDGAGDGDLEGDGRHTASSSATYASASLSLTSDVFVQAEDGRDCASDTADPDRGQFIPGACIEYSYEITNAEGGTTATDVEFDTELSPHLKFASATFEGLDTGIPIQPAPNSDCATTSCRIAIAGAELRGGDTGRIRIRALIK